jgi:membrane fusion protein, multidrug efflux system
MWRRSCLFGVAVVRTTPWTSISRPRAEAGVLLATLALVACGQQQAPPAPPPVEVGVLEVRPRDLALALEYPAQLRGVREVEVRARVSGILLERRYEEGASVKAGDLMFRIDPEPFRADVARARADVAVQQANLGQARRERDRILPLYDQRLASLRDRDTSLAAFESAEAAVAATEAALRSAELALSYTDVRAPIDGMTSREVRSEGSLVTAGDDSSLLTYIVQADRLYVDFAVSDTDADLVARALADSGHSVAVQVVDTRGRAIGERAPIQFVSPRVDEATGTIAIRAVLDNPTGVLPGRIVRARVEGVTVSDSFVIPKRAIMHGAQGSFVWVVGDDGQAAPTPVRLGALSGNDVAVIDGLSAGNRVVVDGILKVQPGVPVNAAPIAADGAAPGADRGATP